MNRRQFLKGILIAGTAPAIVKADSLMKIWVPNEGGLVVPPDITLNLKNAFISDKFQSLNQFFVSSSQGEYLDNLGCIMNVQRLPYEQDKYLRKRILASFNSSTKAYEEVHTEILRGLT